MRSSAYKCIQIILTYVEINIYPIQHILWQILQNVLGHLDIDVAVTTVFVSFGHRADLNSC